MSVNPTGTSLTPRSVEEFIKGSATQATAYLVPEIPLYLATPETPLWVLLAERLRRVDLPPPYWAMAWPGGQGMARFILDHPLEFKGKRVLDIGAGSGIAAIAAARVGAQTVCAVDSDPAACTAIHLNAQLSGVTLSTLPLVNYSKLPKAYDVLMGGDICYDQAMSAEVIRWLRLSRSAGKVVFISDPGRAYVPNGGMIKRATYKLPTSRELEEMDERLVTVWEMVKDFQDLE